MSLFTNWRKPKQAAGRLPEEDPKDRLIAALENDVLVYRRKLSNMRDVRDSLAKQLIAERETVARILQRNRNLTDVIYAARAEAEANAADAEKYRRSRANLALGTAASAEKRKAAANG